MVAYTFRMPAGIPGDVNRVQTATIETQMVTPSGSSGAPTAYGLPLVIDATSGEVRMLTTTDTDAYGVLVRPYPTNSSQDGLGTSTPPASGPVDVLRRGYISIVLNSASPAAAKGGAVYVWTAATSGGHVQGGWEAAANSTNTIKLTNAYFSGPADSNGITEISFHV